MNKAFVKEDDEEEDESEATPLAPNGKNYLTPAGFKRLNDEYQYLKFKLRPEICSIVQWAAENGDRSENADYQYGKRKLRQIDSRLRFLSKRIDAAEIVDPLDPQRVGCEQIFFSATVTIREEDELERTYSIVGADETAVDRGLISWMSPLANALIKAAVGDWVTFRSPRGLREIEIVKVEYREIEISPFVPPESK